MEISVRGKDGSDHARSDVVYSYALDELLDGPVDNWEPKPKGRGSLFNTKDDFYQNI